MRKNRMFHVTHYTASLLLLLVVLCCSVVLLPAEAPASVSDLEMANHMATLLGEEFEPESVSVTVKDSRAYAEMAGVDISGIRIDTMRLDALITNRDAELVNDVDSLANLIGYSRGEIVLLEKDVNAYFDANDIRGFSNLVFKFSPQGFRADGLFTAEFLLTLRIRLAATGVLGLQSDGVHLENVAVYIEKLKQPDILTNQITSRVNPLLEWSDIPFKVEFKDVTMDDTSAVMTGYPQRFEGGSSAVWTGK